MSPEVITAVITGGIGAFTGLSRALNNFNKKINLIRELKIVANGQKPCTQKLKIKKLRKIASNFKY